MGYTTLTGCLLRRFTVQQGGALKGVPTFATTFPFTGLEGSITPSFIQPWDHTNSLDSITYPGIIRLPRKYPEPSTIWRHRRETPGSIFQRRRRVFLWGLFNPGGKTSFLPPFQIPQLRHSTPGCELAPNTLVLWGATQSGCWGNQITKGKPF